MTDRVAVELRPARVPSGRVRAFPLTQSDWTALLDDGAPFLSAAEHALARRLRELTRFAAQAGEHLWLSAPHEEPGAALLVGRGAAATTESLREAAAAAAGLVENGVEMSPR